MSFENLKTTSRIAADIIRGRAFPETLIPTERNHVECTITRADGSSEYIDGYNSRTNMGATWQANIMGSVVGLPACYIGLSTTAIVPATSDVALAGEITSGVNTGLVRAKGTFAGGTPPTVVGNPFSYTIQLTFISEAITTVAGAGLFDQATGGNLFVEAALSPVATLAINDSIALTWTINM